MLTTHYNNLVQEVANWEDFAIEGTGSLGCCGVDPADISKFPNVTACKNACQNKPAAGGLCPTIGTAFSKWGKNCTFSNGTGLKAYWQYQCCVACCKSYWKGAQYNHDFCTGKNYGPVLQCYKTTKGPWIYRHDLQYRCRNNYKGSAVTFTFTKSAGYKVKVQPGGYLKCAP